MRQHAHRKDAPEPSVTTDLMIPLPYCVTMLASAWRANSRSTIVLRRGGVQSAPHQSLGVGASQTDGFSSAGWQRAVCME